MVTENQIKHIVRQETLFAGIRKPIKSRDVQDLTGFKKTCQVLAVLVCESLKPKWS